jgi:predicted Fe-Mo cluster-binding NifX family protein
MALERWGWASIGVNLLLTTINLVIAAASGSLAVAAEMIHVISDHFGTAPVFSLRDLRIEDGVFMGQSVVTNPYADSPRGRGLKVAQWLIAQDVDVLVTADDIRDKGPGFALGDAGIEVIVTDAAELEEVLAKTLEKFDGSRGAS